MGEGASVWMQVKAPVVQVVVLVVQVVLVVLVPQVVV